MSATRWGVFEPSARQPELLVVLPPPEVVRYLFRHDLHHETMNHSAALRLSRSREPEYGALDRELPAGWRTVPALVVQELPLDGATPTRKPFVDLTDAEVHWELGAST